MIDRYSFDDWLNYGRRGKREYSCFRFYSVGLNRGMPRDLGIEYRKNLDGLFEVVDGKRGEALQRVGRLVTYHRGLGNVKPSAQNPATKVGEIFDVIGPYLAG